ncbi:LysR family transcriptional regulator [Shewanella fidelis]|uniref:LysR family transcriptional regulator n=1 Tax=Shewanella fidelis TaxID=173509 RepID=A0AAW8NMC6_9GAMM|nr:LysR family transcriptional regulator [Shewanella fidelis]MDR8523915.1 LysR family transcriptional regulator [Shewanella fidelis]MDW4810462.1 LysR family transcriptional regulator [Shewanella fidelis]MDW4814583.1 LysR family transcriptional regulator [Shewanella fidelis]MDW4818673.1 LysR family transcriptional regulator [Shewanella fidelis]MDW4823650.1 LysR family transcriptional regulator [Shewanella fidelis]
MNISRIDLNLLVYLDVLLREKNVTKAADQLGISQPAMSNGLKRLRTLFDDPLLIRTSQGMTPTERAQELQPTISELIIGLEKAVQPRAEFNAAESEQVFRVMASDYAEATLLPPLIARLRTEAPNVILDIMTPSDVSFPDVEQGRVDMVINRFDSIPQSFHQKVLWNDDFSCLISKTNPVLDKFSLDSYLKANHVWVSKTGMGVGVGMDPDDVQRLGWVDEALTKIGVQRRITVFTRHYQAACLLAEQQDLIATIPSKMANQHKNNDRVCIVPPPFVIQPIALTMAWSPLLQHNPAHKWMRQLITQTADSFGRN